MNAPQLVYKTGVVSSADGTPIGYRRLGAGPGLIVISGGYLAAQHYMRLAAALANAFTMYVPDRHGRGVSGPPGDWYGMDRECEDVAALLARSGAEFLFGHSSGGLIALQAGQTLPQVSKLAASRLRSRSMAASRRRGSVNSIVRWLVGSRPQRWPRSSRPTTS